MRLIAHFRAIILLLFLSIESLMLFSQTRTETNFNANWYFTLDSTANYSGNKVDFSGWRELNLPHDWSIEGSFTASNPSSSGGGYLPGGIGWYKKRFDIDYDSCRAVWISFDGVYERSEVWINGHYLGLRPNGFINFSYELSKYLNKNGKGNILTVKADNSTQPNTRYYTGSGIYRSVTLVQTQRVYMGDLFIFTDDVDSTRATINIQIPLVNSDSKAQSVQILTELISPQGEIIAKIDPRQEFTVPASSTEEVSRTIQISDPALWSPANPSLYRVRNELLIDGKTVDAVEKVTGLRYFNFDAKTGFWLNGVHTKIRGVCMHSDQGALGTAFNKDATIRQLKMLKEMGVNGIRNAHNPAASEFLDLCDSLGFIVMNETFDVWSNKKNPYDYHLYWNEWYERDLADQIVRDRNHPSVFMWCLGNEVQEQWHAADLGKSIPERLAAIVDSLDGTRPTTIANNEISSGNPVLMTDAIDIIGYNYNEKKWSDVPKMHPGKSFIVTESVSALATRGQYDLFPVDSIRQWPERWDILFDGGNADQSISAYDHVRTPWGSTHERSLYLSETLPWVSGMYIWTGFDYLGEPTPYIWPSRSSYFGIIDLAGFAKDV
ncbi:MAG: glycoside hydrolase family 2 TIM barrel-domain containing protein [Sphingobacterium sp.]